MEVILKSPGILESQTCNAFYDASCLIASLRVRFSSQIFSILVVVICVSMLKGAKLPSFPGRGMQDIRTGKAKKVEPLNVLLGYGFAALIGVMV